MRALCAGRPADCSGYTRSPNSRSPTRPRSLAPAFHDGIDVPAPGIGWSAIVTSSPTAPSAAILQLIERHWAVFAYYMVVDRQLLLLLDRVRWSSPTRLPALEDEARRVFDSQAAIQHVRLRIDSALAAIGGDEQAMWDRVAGVQNFGAFVDGVERKTALLRGIAERRVQEARIAATRWTTRILSFLTALTIVTVAIGGLGAFLGYHTASYDDLILRASVVVAAFLLAITVFVVAFRYRDWRPRPRRTRPGRRRNRTR